jgi:hypothetical protein
MITHPTRDDAVEYVKHKCRVGEGLVLDLDENMMPSTTIIVRGGVVVKTAVKDTMSVDQAKAAYDAARDAYEDARRGDWTVEDRRYYEAALREARAKFERIANR